MKRTVLSAIVCISLFSGASAFAQSGAHDGFYMQIQGGLGYYSTTADAGGIEQSYSGVTVPMSLLLGGGVIPGLTIGGGFHLDYAPSPTFEQNGTEVAGFEFTQMVIGLGLFADYYLDPSGGLHFQGFAGWGGLETSTDAGAGGSDPTGLVAYLGAGYDMYLSDTWSIGGMARFEYAPIALNGIDYPTIAPALVATITYQ